MQRETRYARNWRGRHDQFWRQGGCRTTVPRCGVVTVVVYGLRYGTTYTYTSDRDESRVYESRSVRFHAKRVPSLIARTATEGKLVRGSDELTHPIDAIGVPHMVMDNHADRTHSLPVKCSSQSRVHTQVATRRTQRHAGILDLACSRCMIYEYSEHRPARAITCVTL